MVDYAGVFPPAAVTLEAARENYAAYLASEDAWLLGRFVIDASRAEGLPCDWRLSVLSETDHARASSIECKRVLATPKPTYCEVPLELLPEVKRVGSYAKLRCADATSFEIAAFIGCCLTLKLPAKFTAGLHDPLRHESVHGFVNVFAAAAFAYAGVSEIEALLDERDPSAFHWTDNLQWRGYTLRAIDIKRARQEFAHSFGSCSFEEPVRGLREFGWL